MQLILTLLDVIHVHVVLCTHNTCLWLFGVVQFHSLIIPPECEDTSAGQPRGWIVSQNTCIAISIIFQPLPHPQALMLLSCLKI